MWLDTDTILWIGTDHGLCSYQINKNLFTRYRIASDAPVIADIKDIRTIYEDNNETLWVGTNAGLVKFSKKEDN